MQVADCYIHVLHSRLSRPEFEDLRERLLGVADELARSVRRGSEIDFTFEEGTLLQRIVVIGKLAFGVAASLSIYHNLRASVIEIVQDAESFGTNAIDQFRKLTHSTPDKDIYKRTTSRDINRLHRIISSFDAVSEGQVPSSQIAPIRRQVIHDLAGLARTNPDDPDIAVLVRHLPRDRFPNLPSTPIEAVRLDDMESERRKRTEEPLYPPKGGKGPQPTPRRRYHTRVPIKR